MDLATRVRGGAEAGLGDGLLAAQPAARAQAEEDVGAVDVLDDIAAAVIHERHARRRAAREAEKVARSVPITVREFTGKVLPFSVEDNVSDLKAKVQTATGAPSDAQRLIVEGGDGKPLEDGTQRLSECVGLESGALVHLIMQDEGQGRARREAREATREAEREAELAVKRAARDAELAQQHQRAAQAASDARKFRKDATEERDAGCHRDRSCSADAGGDILGSVAEVAWLVVAASCAGLGLCCMLCCKEICEVLSLFGMQN